MQINHAVEVANILRHNIVQGARDAEADENAKWGTYSKTLFGGLARLRPQSW